MKEIVVMKSISRMNYRELFMFGIELKETKEKSAFLNDLYVFDNHLCKKVLMSDYQTYGDETPYAYLDIFADQYVGMASFISSVPTFYLVLKSYGITPSLERVGYDELFNLWNTYQNNMKAQER